MNASIASQKTNEIEKAKENCTGRHLKGLKNQNGEHLINLSKSNSPEIQVIFRSYNDELARTLFPFESTNNIKIKITRHRCIGDGCIWEGISLMNAFQVSQSVSVQSSFRKQPVMTLYLKENNGEIIFYLKRTVKRLCNSITKLYENYCEIQGRKLGIFVSCTKQNILL